MEMPWTITITGLMADGMEVDVVSGAIAGLLRERGHRDITVSARPAPQS